MNVITYLIENKVLASQEEAKELIEKKELRLNDQIVTSDSRYNELPEGNNRIEIGTLRNIYVKI